MNRNLFDQITKPIKDVLTKMQLPSSQIDNVILCGGACNIPKIQQLVLKAAEKDHFLIEEGAVAKGAGK